MEIGETTSHCLNSASCRTGLRLILEASLDSDCSSFDVVRGVVCDLDECFVFYGVNCPAVGRSTPNAWGVLDILTCRGSGVRQLHLSLEAKARFGAKLRYPTGPSRINCVINLFIRNALGVK